MHPPTPAPPLSFAGQLGVLIAALLFVPSCASSTVGPPSCRRSEFSHPDQAGAPSGELRSLFVGQIPAGVVCSLKTSGFRNLDHAVFVVRSRASRSVVVLVQTEAGTPARFEAPLDDNIGPMLERICTSSLAARSNCSVGGIDGDWHYVEAITETGEHLAAVTWSPVSGTDSDTVLDVFRALRAYASAPDPMRPVALNTLYSETYSAYVTLGLFKLPNRKSP